MIVSKYDVGMNGLRPYKHHDTDPEEIQIATALMWLTTYARPRKSFNPKAHSYSLKHAVERWTESDGPYDQIDHNGRPWQGHARYISNGAFIVAALRAGYRLRRDGINAIFAMSVAKEGWFYAR